MWKRIVQFFKTIRRLEVPIFAAYGAYFLLLSIFPAMMLLMSILQLTPISPAGLRELLQGVIPSSIQPLTDYMIDELFAVNAPTVLSLSAVTALWMTSKGVLSLQRGLNRIYLVRETRNPCWLRLRAILFSLAGVLALVLLLALQLASHDVVTLLLSEGNDLGLLLLGLANARHLLSALLLTGFFTAVYALLPNRKAPPRTCLPGALAAAGLLAAFSRLFSLYVDSFTNFTLYYGSLTVIAVAMLWLYISIFLFFCGGVFNRELEREKAKRAAKVPAPKSSDSEV